LGEILLVVIGILIALQINNWNENRKNETFELMMLDEIKSSLLIDLKRFERLLKRMVTKEKAMNQLLFAKNNQVPLSDEIILKAIYDSKKSILFTFDVGAYESLKSIGLDKIKNNKLRNRIIRHYEVNLKRFKVFFDDIHSEHIPESKQIDKTFNEQKLVFDVFVNQTDSNYVVKTVINNQALMNSEILEKFLMIEFNIKNDYIARLKDIIEITKSVLEQINAELFLRKS